MFRVGQKVVCVEAFTGDYVDGSGRDNKPLPEIREIYTADGYSPTNGLYLKELNYIGRYSRVCFVDYKFRPIDEQFGHQVASEIE